MFTEQEKEFMDAVARIYCCPAASTHRSCTMTVADAAYYAVRERGELGPVGEETREAFFKDFMGGLMRRTEAKEYIMEAANVIRANLEQHAAEMSSRRKAACEAALEQMEIILKAAQEIRGLTTGLDGVVPVFSKNSMEMNVLQTAKYHISCIGTK